MKQATNKIEYRYGDWVVWQNESHGDWGAILSRRGERPVIIDGKRSEEELIDAIIGYATRHLS